MSAPLPFQNVYREDYKTLANGFKYRKVGTDVEINIKTSTNTTYETATTTVGTLPERI